MYVALATTRSTAIGSVTADRTTVHTSPLGPVGTRSFGPDEASRAWASTVLSPLRP
jgi:hypothetical protein